MKTNPNFSPTQNLICYTLYISPFHTYPSLCHFQIVTVFKIKALLWPQPSHDVLSSFSLQPHLRSHPGPLGDFIPQGFSMDSFFCLEYWSWFTLHLAAAFSLLRFQFKLLFCHRDKSRLSIQFSFVLLLPPLTLPWHLCKTYHNFYLATYLHDNVMFVSS